MEREVHAKLSSSILLNTSALGLFCVPGNMFPSDIFVYLIRRIVFSGENVEYSSNTCSCGLSACLVS